MGSHQSLFARLLSICALGLRSLSAHNEELSHTLTHHVLLAWRKRLKGTEAPGATATAVPTPADGGAATAVAVVEEHTEGGDEILTATVPSAVGGSAGSKVDGCGGVGGGSGGGGTRAVFNMTEACLSRLQLLGSSDSDGGGAVDLLETSQHQSGDAREEKDEVGEGGGGGKEGRRGCFKVVPVC